MQARRRFAGAKARFDGGEHAVRRVEIGLRRGRPLTERKHQKIVILRSIAIYT